MICLLKRANLERGDEMYKMAAIVCVRSQFIKAMIV